MLLQIVRVQPALAFLQSQCSNQQCSRRTTNRKPTQFSEQPPRHVAFICDGNSRWARQRNLPTAIGHAAGADRLIQVLDQLKQSNGVVYCTMYGFSTENWKRPLKEVQEILHVMETTARRFYDKAIQEGVRVRILGDLTDSRIPTSLRDVLQKLELESAACAAEKKTDSLTLSIAINYGGRDDILKACTKMVETMQQHHMRAEDVTEDLFQSFLSTRDIPDPDLIIRTSGESRISNFLLWNAAYSELYFTETLWPDFDVSELNKALAWYSNRQRRFGARKDPSVASLEAAYPDFSSN